MSNFPENENKDINQQSAEEVKADNALTSEEEFSTIFSDPDNNRKKKKTNGKNKRIMSVICSFMALLILIGGTFAVVKFIPKKKEEVKNPYNPDINVLTLKEDDIKTVEITSKKGAYTLLSRPNTDKETVDKEKFIWHIDGVEEKFTRSTSISYKVAAAAAIKAISVITEKTAEECGFAKPSCTVDIFMKDGKQTKIEFGAESADKAGAYLRVLGDDKIYLVSASVLHEFEFEPLDVANAEAMPGLEITDDIDDYVKEGALDSFDSITVTGKNYPEPLIISLNKDEGLSEYFKYIISSPEKHIANNNIDSVFNIFKEGISVAGAYSFDTSAQALKKVGLDKPFMNVTIKVGNASRTFKISKIDGQFSAVITEGSYMIHKVTNTNLPFLDLVAKDYYNELVYIESLDKIKEFVMEYGDKKYTFGISYDEDAKDNKYKVSYNGKQLTAEFFQNFYKDFVGITYVDYITDMDVSKKDMAITIKYNNGQVDKIEYSKNNATRYACVINGKIAGRVSSTEINRLIKDIENVVQNKDIP